MTIWFVKRVMVKPSIPPFIKEETVRRVLQKTGLKCTHFQRKGSLTKNDLKLRLSLLKICRKRAMVNYEICNSQKAYGTKNSRT